MKKIVTFCILLLALCALLAALPTSAMELSDAPNRYAARSWNETAKAVETEIRIAESYTQLTAESTSLAEGWYIVTGDVTVSERITVTGTVHLILAEGCTLTALEGIAVEGDNVLNIYGQGEDSGKLIATTTNREAAAIGGGASKDSGIINIYGGTISAQSTQSGAGIGGSYQMSSKEISIYGGTVTANASSGAGIGSGSTIYNLQKTIYIYGGTVTAASGKGAGIGGGSAGKANVVIKGGTVKASSQRGEPLCNGYAFLGSGGTKTITGGTVTEGKDTTFYSDVTIAQDYTVASDETLTVMAGVTLSVERGVTLTNNGSIVNNGVINSDGTIVNHGTVQNSGLIRSNGEFGGDGTEEGEGDYQYTLHRHTWGSFGKDGDRIVAHCSNEDGLCAQPIGSVSLAPPADPTYTGKVVEIVVNSDLGVDYLIPVQYSGPSLIGGKSVNAGTYTATVTLGEVSIQITYTVEKLAPKAADFSFKIPGRFVYTGEAKAATVAPLDHIVGMGSYALRYSADPINVGSYSVSLDVAEGENYLAATGITDAQWSFSIFAADASDVAVAALPESYPYTGDPVEPDLTLTYCGMQLLEGRDYTCTYSNNVCGSAKLTITLIGNYTGEIEKGFYVAHPSYDSKSFCTVCGGFQPCEGRGTEADPYRIANVSQLYFFAAVVNSGYGAVPQNSAAFAILTADIVDNDNVFDEGEGTQLRSWVSIGTVMSSYSGTFDGKGHTVSGLHMTDDTISRVGLFGYVSHAGVIKNVGVIESCFRGATHTAGIASYSYGTVSNCFYRGKISYRGTNARNAAGIVGENYGTVSGCYNLSDISGYVNIGGIVGYNYGTVKGCYNLGTVSGNENIGGIAGYNYGTVEGCYNLGTVSGTVSVGGIVGFNYHKIKHCYSLGTVSGMYRDIGGVAGYTSGSVESNVLNCYYLDTAYSGGINGVDTVGSAEAKSAAEFASGAVAYLLNGKKSVAGEGETLYFGQRIGTDAYPVLRTEENTVYFGYICDVDVTDQIYTNICTAGATKPDHVARDDDGSCLTEIGCRYCAHIVTQAREAHLSNADDGNCETAISCQYCPTVMTVAIKHAFTDCTDASCNNADCTVTRVAQSNHTYDADCTDNSCNNAGCTVTREAKAHAFETWMHDADGHWHVCANEGCTVTDTKAAHSGKELCDACGVELPKEGLPGGAVAGIVCGSVAVVLIGGFALFWFVIKRKSWHELFVRSK